MPDAPILAAVTASLVGVIPSSIIAWLVLQNSRQQAERANALADRAQRVEDQKMRLALLDRRFTVYSGLRAMILDKTLPKKDIDDFNKSIKETLEFIELLYDDHIKSETHKAFALHIGLTMLRMRELDANKNKDLSSAQELSDRIFAAEKSLNEEVQRLVPILREATRIQMVPPIAPTSEGITWPARIDAARMRS